MPEHASTENAKTSMCIPWTCRILQILDHTADHLQTEAHHTTPEIETCHIHVHPTNLHNEIHIGHTCTPVEHEANHITRRTPD